MSNIPFSESKAKALATEYLKYKTAYTTQEIVGSLIPDLKDFTVVPGKVSDSIFGGPGSYTKKDGEIVSFTNPPLEDKEGNPIRILVRTEQISTHDISRGTIPFKDQILSLNHNFMRKLVQPWLPHAQYEIGLPDTAVVSFAKNVRRFPIENIVRASMAKTTTSTSLYQHYWIKKETEFCGIALYRYENEISPNGRLPFVMDTPSTKSTEHDMSVAPEELFEIGIFDEQDYRSIRNNSLVAFGVVAGYLRQKDIVLVDTKTEHGIDDNGKILAIDELYTMDSSRFWKMTKDGTLLTDEGGDPISFSKEFARGFSVGNEGYTNEQRIAIAVRYMEGIQLLTEKEFIPDQLPWHERVVKEIKHGLVHLKK